MAKVPTDRLRKPENAQWVSDGQLITRAWQLSGLLLKEFCDRVGRDERQVRAWMNGEERPQLETVRAARGLRPCLLIAFAEEAGVEVITEIRIPRRTA